MAKPFVDSKRPRKLPASCRIDAEYQSKWASNVYADILSLPIRTDRSTKLRFPWVFLGKYDAFVYGSGKEDKNSTILVDTTESKLSGVVLKPSIDTKFKKFESSYLFLNKELILKLKTKNLAAFIPQRLMRSKRPIIDVKKIQVKLDTDLFEQELISELNRLIQSIDVNSLKGDDMLISWNEETVDNTSITLSLFQVDGEFKQLLQKIFTQETTSVAYNSETKQFIQFVYKIINYYR